MDLQIKLQKYRYKKHSLGVQANLATNVQHGLTFCAERMCLGDEVSVNKTACKMVSSLLSVHPVGPEI